MRVFAVSNLRLDADGRVTDVLWGVIAAMTIESTDTPDAATSILQTKPARQKRSLERGKATHRKNPGKRAKSGG